MGGWISCEFRKRFARYREEKHEIYIRASDVKEKWNEREREPELKWLERSRGFQDLDKADK